jgi:hypothetical protein
MPVKGKKLFFSSLTSLFTKSRKVVLDRKTRCMIGVSPHRVGKVFHKPARVGLGKSVFCAETPHDIV